MKKVTIFGFCCIFFIIFGQIYNTKGFCIEIDDDLYTSAKSGNLESLYKLGCIYFNESFDDVDMYAHLVSDPEYLALSMYYFKKAALGGHSEANAELGSLYFNGCDLVKKDIKKAKFYNLKASKLGNFRAMSTLAYIYYSEKKFAESLNLYKKIINTSQSDDKYSAFSILSYIYSSDTEYANKAKFYACQMILLSITSYDFYKSKADELYLEMNDFEKKHAKKILNHWIRTKQFLFD